MRNVARELDEYHTLADTLGLRSLGIEYIDHGMGISAGKLRIVHGHEIGGSGVNVARSKLLKAKTNVLFGHHHRTQEHSQTDMDGNGTGSWAVGCLCQRTPEWARINEWNLGYARVEFEPSGEFTVDNHRIIHGRIR